MFLFSDGDLITIFDSSDLSFAIQCSRILKLTLFGKLHLSLHPYRHVSVQFSVTTEASTCSLAESFLCTLVQIRCSLIVVNF